MSKRHYVIKLGTTFSATRQCYGDFDRWTRDLLGPTALEIGVIDAEHGETLPNPAECAGVVITGSHDMVTEEHPWSVRVGQWMLRLLEQEVPLLGICYGHQLLAHVTGGKVGYHPQGKEVGTVEIEVLDSGREDELFKEIPAHLKGHVTHAQTVLELPPEAVRLARNDFEPNHAFRLGPCAWGVQFHPEFDAAIMRSYVLEQREELNAADRDIDIILATIQETPVAVQVGHRFARMVEGRMTHS